MSTKLRDILVISDMDGTLLTDDQRLLGCNLQTIRLFTRLGGRFTVATGRTVASVAMYPELVECLAPAITSGGTVIYDLWHGKTIASEVLPRAVAKMALRDVMQAFPKIAVIVFVDNLPYMVTSGPQGQQLFDEENISYLVRPFDELPNDWNKVIFAGRPEELAAIDEYVAGRTYPGTYFVHTGPIYFEMMPEGVTKGTAMEKLCWQLNVKPQNTIVIGDYYNDLDIMARAGRSVAVGNAPADVIMQADEVIASNAEGGVGQFLYRLIDELG